MADDTVNQTDALLKMLVEQSVQTAAVLEKVTERLEALEQAGTMALPEGIPEPDGIMFPRWEDMDNVQRQAWVRANTGYAPPAEPEDESEVLELGDGLYGQFPTPSDKAKEQWAKDAPAIFENIPTDWPISQEGAIEAYSQGGPLWLAAYGDKAHRWLMELPKEWRRQMVATVTSYAPAAGSLLGKDILKAKTDEANDYSYEQNLGWADARREGVVVLPGPGDAIQRD